MIVMLESSTDFPSLVHEFVYIYSLESVYIFRKHQTFHPQIITYTILL